MLPVNSNQWGILSEIPRCYTRRLIAVLLASISANVRNALNAVGDVLAADGDLNLVD